MSASTCSTKVSWWPSASRRIDRRCRLGIEEVGTGGDQHGIDAIALGTAQVQFGEGAHLQRLQHDDRKAGGLQVAGDAPFVAAAGLDADALDAVAPEPVGNGLPAGGYVLGRERAISALYSDVKPILAGIDPGRARDAIDHLRLTPPCESNLSFEQPSGSDEEAGAIRLHESSPRLRAESICRQPPGPGWPPGAGRSLWNTITLADVAITRSE